MLIAILILLTLSVLTNAFILLRSAAAEHRKAALAGTAIILAAGVKNLLSIAKSSLFRGGS